MNNTVLSLSSGDMVVVPALSDEDIIEMMREASDPSYVFFMDESTHTLTEGVEGTYIDFISMWSTDFPEWWEAY